MADIHLRCTKCNSNTTARLSTNGVCRDCILADLVALERARYVALLTKKYRYAVAGKLHAFNDDQRFKAEKKLIIKLRTFGPWLGAAELEAYLRECRMEAESRTAGVKRIYVAHAGDVGKEAPGLETSAGLLSGVAQVGMDAYGRRVTTPEIVRPNR